MDRFSEESAAQLARNYYARRRNPEPFFTEAEPCEVCGDPCEERELHHESGLLIGTKCSCSIPDQPNPCPVLWAIYCDPPCETLNAITAAHRKTCAVCTPVPRKEAASETRTPAESEDAA